MGTKIYKTVTVGAGAVLLGLTAVAAAGSSNVSRSIDAGPLLVAPGATLELDGDSTLHRYSAKAQGVAVGIRVDAARLALIPLPANVEALVRGYSIKSLELTVPVDKLSSGERGLDKNMRNALKSDRYRDIHFFADSYDLLAASTAGTVFVVMLHGRLDLAGVERPIDVRATGTRVGDGIRFKGTKELLMSDYQIKPPTMMLGTIKTADLITVKFDATLLTASNK